MEMYCNKCDARNISLAAHERAERTTRRLCALILVLVLLLFASNLAWVLHEKSFEEETNQTAQSDEISRWAICFCLMIHRLFLSFLATKNMRISGKKKSMQTIGFYIKRLTKAKMCTILIIVSHFSFFCSFHFGRAASRNRCCFALQGCPATAGRLSF